MFDNSAAVQPGSYDYVLYQAPKPLRVGDIMIAFDRLETAIGKTLPMNPAAVKLISDLRQSRQRFGLSAQNLAMQPAPKASGSCAVHHTVKTLLAQQITQSFTEALGPSGLLRKSEMTAENVNIFRLCAEKMIQIHVEDSAV